ncbi:heat shock protein Hsp20 [Desulfacinum hydrothermale DSM 13146]|uniref:Heat shock protein Hsp20 n=1 Tax=Desulfacinum hydrothermale DSM 13146 TaxID=1121390 RepID=A0A1W1XNY7_9BACT|nr:Hsp20/alpha crystallin family protein [Desulfacinum hydrothermale]SMC25584.1 heat shock protein Hsp20 [Desulfacinum hydrothermale DSM 13146]
MALLRWSAPGDLFRPFEEMEREMERLRAEMDRLLPGFRSLRTARVGVFPPLNVSEDKDNLYVRAELPGMHPDQIEISVEGDTLTLRGERKPAPLGDNVSYHRREREFGRFRRSLTLPTRIDVDAVEATFNNGVLTIVLPKAQEVRPKQIPVKAQ